MPDSLLIENGTVITGGALPEVLPGHSVLIENGLIEKIGPVGKFAGKRIDASGRVVLPGFINAHTHFYSAFARGLTKTKPAGTFVDVLKNLWWRLDSALKTEDCYYSALVASLDCIRHGTTTVIDHHASPNAVTGSLAAIAKAVKETGLRACLCYELSDRDGDRIAQAGLEENASFIRQGQSDFIKALFGLHASFTISDRTLEKAAALGRELHAGFHIHVAEAQGDQDATLRDTGLRVVERLKRSGILGDRTIAAHCVHVSPPEIEMLAETRTAVAHNPQSNLNNAVGIADIAAMSRAGVLLGLGTDSMTTNMLEELRVAIWAQRLLQENPSAGFAEATAALFAGNPKIAGKIFGVPVGELREGAAGDVVLMEYDPPTPLEPGNVLGHLVFGMSQCAVDTTIVAGKVLMQRRQLKLDVDEARINARARELAAKLWERL
jgi:putative selenium metabolism protein SsnA